MVKPTSIGNIAVIKGSNITFPLGNVNVPVFIYLFIKRLCLYSEHFATTLSCKLFALICFSLKLSYFSLFAFFYLSNNSPIFLCLLFSHKMTCFISTFDFILTLLYIKTMFRHATLQNEQFKYSIVLFFFTNHRFHSETT